MMKYCIIGLLFYYVTMFMFIRLYVNLYILKSGSDFILPCVVLFFKEMGLPHLMWQVHLCHIVQFNAFYYIIFNLIFFPAVCDYHNRSRERNNWNDQYCSLHQVEKHSTHVHIDNNIHYLFAHRYLLTASVFLLWAMPNLALVPTPALTICCL